MAQLHKKFTDEAVKDLLEKYINKVMEIEVVLGILGIKRRRFFRLLKEYKNDPNNFSIQYNRKSVKRIDEKLEKNIIKELRTEKEQIIDDKSIPTNHYNYNYIKDLIYRKYKQKVSLPTIIDRAKKNNFYIPKSKGKKNHDREVLTNYAGELVQHDTSFHKWAVYSSDKWYLITSLDDYSRLMLYAELVEKETNWAHITALQAVFLKFGIPATYYVDSHAIFRFVQGRDSIWRNHKKITDDIITQWKKVLYDCNVKVIHALSPQAKGKVERPYSWLQDRIVRTCVRDNVKTISSAKEVLKYEVNRYNNQIHSTTREIPINRFENALKENKSFFREFTIKPPFEDVKDIFCLRIDRIVNSYRRISINNIELSVSGAPIGEKVELRIFFNEKTYTAEIRMWFKNKLIGVQNVKSSDLDLVHF
jgi:hypothetical protein